MPLFDALHAAARAALRPAPSLKGAEALDAEQAGGSHGPVELESPRFGPAPPTCNSTGAIGAMPFHAGQARGVVRAVESAAAIADLGAGVQAAVRGATRGKPPGPVLRRRRPSRPIYGAPAMNLVPAHMRREVEANIRRHIDPSLPVPGQRAVFVSYRRADVPHAARAVQRWLVDAYGPQQVFFDVDVIEIGRDFRQVIAKSLSECAAAVVVIGPAWLGTTDDLGRRRINNPDDVVRYEVAAALERPAVRTIPVLIDAHLPASGDLPAQLRALAALEPVAISRAVSDDDLGRLATRLGPISRVDRSLPLPAGDWSMEILRRTPDSAAVALELRWGRHVLELQTLPITRDGWISELRVDGVLVGSWRRSSLKGGRHRFEVADGYDVLRCELTPTPAAVLREVSAVRRGEALLGAFWLAVEDRTWEVE
jgi:hypothetical protein